MNKLLGIAFAVGFSFAAVSPSQAVPVSPVNPSDIVIQIAGGCGPGWHRGPYGGCRRNMVAPPPRYRMCPPGYHRGPYGRCRPNW